MNVTLLSVTPDALNLLLRTKNTRLGADFDPADLTAEQREEHLSYMKDTIKSSWEMVDYIFELKGVTRSCTQQIERTRTGSYAEQSLRAVDAREAGWRNPLKGLFRRSFENTARNAFLAYETWVDNGVPMQDARGILPLSTLTNLVAKFNLRTLHEMAKVRLCTRTQGEYQSVFRAMRAAVITVHPWVEQFRFIEVQCAQEGTCAFPRYGKKECQFYDPRMDRRELKEITFHKFWSSEIQEANPVARDGKTM